MTKARFNVNSTLAETGFENNNPKPHDTRLSYLYTIIFKINRKVNYEK
ncbi:MAG: hypothetical protein K2L64_02145 [Ureaplasma sp.]|nr:hypothetical protein [Ureaplasma sp.]MDE6289546.1 hypothetical protein [Ureaplasma sp.]